MHVAVSLPRESPQAMADFYDVGYSEPQALDLPDDKKLNEMLETGFKGSQTRISRITRRY